MTRTRTAAAGCRRLFTARRRSSLCLLRLASPPSSARCGRPSWSLRATARASCTCTARSPPLLSACCAPPARMPVLSAICCTREKAASSAALWTARSVSGSWRRRGRTRQARAGGEASQEKRASLLQRRRRRRAAGGSGCCVSTRCRTATAGAAQCCSLPVAEPRTAPMRSQACTGRAEQRGDTIHRDTGTVMQSHAQQQQATSSSSPHRTPHIRHTPPIVTHGQQPSNFLSHFRLSHSFSSSSLCLYWWTTNPTSPSFASPASSLPSSSLTFSSWAYTLRLRALTSP